MVTTRSGTDPKEPSCVSEDSMWGGGTGGVPAAAPAPARRESRACWRCFGMGLGCLARRALCTLPPAPPNAPQVPQRGSRSAVKTPFEAEPNTREHPALSTGGGTRIGSPPPRAGPALLCLPNGATSTSAAVTPASARAQPTHRNMHKALSHSATSPGE